MPYIPNSDNAAAPLDTEFASTAAAEFRALKLKVNGFFLAAGYNADENSNHTDKALALFNINQDNGTNIVYSVLGLARRSGGTGTVVGGYFSASVGDNVELGAGVAAQGLLVEVNTSSVASIAPELCGGCFHLVNRNDTGQDRIFGVMVNFRNRDTALADVAGGLGDDKYNLNAIALSVQSQRRSDTGEKCGWKIGLRFEDFSLDEDDAGPVPVAIDFTGISQTDATGDGNFVSVPFHFNTSTLSEADGTSGGAIDPPTKIDSFIPVMVNGVAAYGIPLYALDL